MASSRNLIRRIVLMFDRSAGKKAERDAEQSVGKLDKGFDRLRATALRVGAALGAVFALRKIKDFVAGSIRAFNEQDVIWNRLAGTLRTVGIEFDGVELRIRAAARALQDTTTIGDEQFASTLQELVVISGDFEASLRNVEVVADLAAGAQIDLSTAAQLVGRAMVGETGTLKRYGIIVEEGADAVEHMRKQFAGLAANEANTLQGKVRQLANEWGDFKEELGAALVETDGANGLFDVLIGKVKDLTTWVEDNRATVQRITSDMAGWARMIVSTTDFLINLGRHLDTAFSKIPILGRRLRERLADEAEQHARDILRKEEEEVDYPELARTRRPSPGTGPDEEEAARKRQEAVDKWIGLLGKAHEMQALTGAEIDRAAQLEEELRQQLLAGNLALADRLKLIGQINTLAEISGRREAVSLGPLTPLALPEPGPVKRSPRPRTEITRLDPGELSDARLDRERRVEAARDAMERAGRQAEELGSIGTGGLETFFDVMITGFKDGADAAGTFADAFEGMGRYIIAQLIEGWAQKEFALGISALAAALWPVPNPAAAAASAKHFAAAAAFTALGGLVAGGRSGGAGAGSAGSVPRGAADLGRTPLRAQPLGPPVNIYLAAEFDMMNPTLQRLVYGAEQYGKERFGEDADVRIIRRGRTP